MTRQALVFQHSTRSMNSSCFATRAPSEDASVSLPYLFLCRLRALVSQRSSCKRCYGDAVAIKPTKAHGRLRLQATVVFPWVGPRCSFDSDDESWLQQGSRSRKTERLESCGRTFSKTIMLNTESNKHMVNMGLTPYLVVEPTIEMCGKVGGASRLSYGSNGDDALDLVARELIISPV